MRISKLNGLIGDFSLREPKEAWEQFRYQSWLAMLTFFSVTQQIEMLRLFSV
ncbi:hypothetical protein [Sphingobium sp. TomTYG45]